MNPSQVPGPRLRPVIRVFVSSTFSDMKHERNALQAEVFPRIERLCQRSGFDFQAIDLRWGVSAEAGLDHRTMTICLGELRRAQDISPKPNFLALLGDRYGWRPLPEEISIEEFRTLEAAAEHVPGVRGLSALAILSEWYVEDQNAVPPVCILQSRRRRLADQADYTTDAAWNEVQQVLWAIINRAVPVERLSARFEATTPGTGAPPPVVRFQASATEQEIWHGALRVPDADEHVLAFFRAIASLDEIADPRQVADFVDVTPSGTIDAILRTEQASLKAVLRRRLGEANVLKATVELVPGAEPSRADVSTTHIAGLCAEVEVRLSRIVQAQIDEYWGGSAPASPERAQRELRMELGEHGRFARERGGEETFVGREAELRAILDYVAGDSRWPLVVHGASGSGKTALLARASALIATERRVVMRLIGATPLSTELQPLLRGICQELRLERPLEQNLPTDAAGLQEELREQLRSATADRPLVLLLDALDQLSDRDDGRQLRWIPDGPLPAHVKIIVSCLSDRVDRDPAGRPFVELKRRYGQQSTFIVLDVLSPREARTLLLDRWMPAVGRTLTAEQCVRVEQRLESASCREPLYLKLLFEEVRRWRSFDPAPAIGQDVPALLAEFFARLRQPTHHGPAIVDRALGYLSVSRWGLAENELLTLLYADDEYRAAFERQAAQTGHLLPPGATRIPIAVWARLRFDLAPYCSERVAAGATVLTFGHGRIAEWVRDYVGLTPADARVLHRRLAAYFENIADPEGGHGWKGDAPRPFLELPFHLARSAPDALAPILFELRWLCAKLRTTSPHEARVDCDEAIEALALDHPMRPGLRLLRDAVGLASGVLRGDVHQLPGQLLGRLAGHSAPNLPRLIDECTGWNGFTCLLPLFSETLPILEPPGGALVAALGEHASGVLAVGISQDGTLAVSGAMDGSVNVWDLARLRRLQVLAGHEDEVNAVVLARLDRGPVVVSGAGKRLPFKLHMQLPMVIERTDVRPSRDTSIRVWDHRDGSLLHTLSGHTGAVRCLAASGRLLLSGSDDGTVRMWDLQDGASLGQLGDCEAPVVLLELMPRRLAVFAFTEYSFRMFDIVARKDTGPGNFDHYWQNVVAADPERALIALQEANLSGDEFKLLVWDVLRSTDGDEKLDSITTFSTSFTAAHFLSEGKEIIVGGTDHLLRRIDIASGAERGRYSGHTGEVTSIAVAEGAGVAVSGGAGGDVLLWDLSRPSVPHQTPAHGDDVNAVAVSKDGRLAVSASYDRTVVIWDARVGRPLHTCRGHTRTVLGVALDAEERRALSGSQDGTVRLWSLDDGRELAKMSGHKEGVHGVAFCRDTGRVISFGADRMMRMWDVAEGLEIRAFAGHRHVIQAMALFHRTDRAVTGDESGQVIIWDLATGAELQHVDAFVDMKLFAEATKDLWETGRGPQWAPSPAEHRAPVIQSLSLSPDDRWLVVAQRGQPIVLWDLEQKAPLRMLHGHEGIVFGTSLSDDGGRLVTAGDDRRVRLWSMAGGECVASFTADAPLYCCAISADGDTIVVGEGSRSSRVHFLRVVESGRSHGD